MALAPYKTEPTAIDNRVSVIIVAHNEERHIERCIKSVLAQTCQADEVVLVVHNSTDQTEEIARRHPITVIPYQGPEGAQHARLKGLGHVSGDIILMTDGDSYMADTWIAVMTETLKRENVLVGSRVLFKGTILGEVGNFLLKKFFNARDDEAAGWIWGQSFAFWSKDKETIAKVLQESARLSLAVGSSRNPDDYWLALFMRKEGALEVTNRTWVTSNMKERDSLEFYKRTSENVRNGLKMRTYFKENHLSVARL